MSTERVIGVDFGTSTSVIRVKRYQDGKPVGDPLETKPVTFNMGSTMVPTLIQKLLSGGAYFGYDAEIPRRKTETFQNFKVNIENSDEDIRRQAQALTVEYFTYLARNYRAQSEGGHLGESGDEERTIISYPVKWNDETKSFMIQTAKDAGFPHVEGIDEAQAAIRAVTVQNASLLTGKGYFKNDVPVNILLIDMGAGTTDLVLCRHTPGQFPKTDILKTWPQSGNALFGGREVDELLKSYVCQAMPEKDADAVLRKIGLEKYKAWKEGMVSPALEKRETVDSFAALDDFLDIMDIEAQYSIDRDSFETHAADYLRQFPELVNGCVRAAGISGDEVDLVILTGGHSQWYFVREMLSGELDRFGEIGLRKIQADPGRVIPISLPQETIALGLVFEPMNINVSNQENEEAVYSVLAPFNNANDREFYQGPGWIEVPAVIFGPNPVRVGQQFAFYNDDGSIVCTLPVTRLLYNGQSMAEVVRTEEYDDHYIPFRVRFAVDDAKKETQETYKKVEWLISAPVSNETFSKTLYGFTHMSTIHWPDGFPENRRNQVVHSFIARVRGINHTTIVCDRLRGELNVENELHVFRKSGRCEAFQWNKATHNMYDCSFMAEGNHRVSIGDIISDCVLPAGFTLNGEMDSEISWKNHVYVQNTQYGPEEGYTAFSMHPSLSNSLSGLFPLAYDPKCLVRPVICLDGNSIWAVSKSGKIHFVTSGFKPEARLSIQRTIQRANQIATDYVSAATSGVFLRSKGTVVPVGINESTNGILKSWTNIISIGGDRYGRHWGIKDSGDIVICSLGSVSKTLHDSDIIAISSGALGMFALKRTGTVLPLEVHTTNSIGIESENDRLRNEVQMLTDVISIAVGHSHIVALHSDGSVEIIGNHVLSLSKPDVRSWRDIVAVSAGDSHTVGLRRDGTVVAVGRNKNGQCDVYGWQNIISIAADGDCTIGLKGDGTLVMAYAKKGFLSSTKPDVSKICLY